MLNLVCSNGQKVVFFAGNQILMEGQNYKIYVNGTPVFLTNSAGVSVLGVKQDKKSHVAPYLGKKKQIRQFIDLLEKNTEVEAVVLFHENVPQLWSDFQACFEPIEAAGGLVFNPSGQLLVFFRRGSWDLPKGKIDPGETPPEAAVREVQEETGIQNIELGPFVGHTLHTYTMKGKRMLKTTWWYQMRTTDTRLVPQTEEDISLIEWVEPRAWLAASPVLYGSIRDILHKWFHLS